MLKSFLAFFADFREIEKEYVEQVEDLSDNSKSQNELTYKSQTSNVSDVYDFDDEIVESGRYSNCLDKKQEGPEYKSEPVSIDSEEKMFIEYQKIEQNLKDESLMSKSS